MKPHLTICIGYDSREPLTLAVLAHSISTRASQPVTFIPIALNHVKDVYTRTDARATTEFSLTRFLTPHIVKWESEWALFLDSDMLVQTDIYSIFDDIDVEAETDIWVCKHDYVPKEGQKATGQQVSYPKKNWSSVMLFKPHGYSRHALTPEYVNTASPSDLHRFAWMDEYYLGSLPLEWNWLVGEYDDNPAAKNLHYTLGAPCFPGYENSPMADLWWAEYRAMMLPMKTYSWGIAEAYSKETGAKEERLMRAQAGKA
jgi:lipopolysaccharide biosynthesis glycosyltransferase